MKKSAWFCSMLLLAIGAAQGWQTVLSSHERDLIAEGITIDPQSGDLYVSSILRRKIVRVNSRGWQDFIGSGQDGFMGGVGLHVDARHRILWACSGNIMGARYRTGIFAYDLQRKKLWKRFLLPSGPEPRFFNDLAIAADGSVYITDTMGHCLWKWDRSAAEPVKLSLGDLPYPNGIALAADPRFLFVATRQGLKRVDLTGQRTELLAMPAGPDHSMGLDGIAWYRGSIVAVQNGVADKAQCRIVRYHLATDGRSVSRVETIDTGNPAFDIPTTLTVDGDRLYVLANSQLDNLDQERLVIRAPERLKPTVILVYRLRDGAG